MSRSDPVAEFLAQLRHQLPATASGRRRLLRESEEHLDYAVAELTASGVPRADAQRIAIQRFGSPESFARQAGYPSRPDSTSGPPSAKRAHARAQTPTNTLRTKYPPLALAGLVMLVLLAALPSALNLPQSNPSQTLEYAPVPPQDETMEASPAGNVASLGLAGGSGAGLGAGGDLAPVDRAGPSGRAVKAPSTKRCVGSPPRQTEDRMSPPCVAHFSGDNGGATYAGVSADEIRVVVYLPGGTVYGGEENVVPYYAEPGTYVDLGHPPRPGDDEEHVFVRLLRGWQRYFNERYQTYGRFVHFWAYFADPAASAEERRADAIDNIRTVSPFAALTLLFGGGELPYIQTMARRGVLNFGSFYPRPASLFREYERQIWSHPPSMDYLAELYAAYVCRQVVPHPVSFSGNGDAGRPRRLGLLSATDPNRPELALAARIIKARVEACGGRFFGEATFGIVSPFEPNSEAPANMAEFLEAGVTTVLWPGGFETSHSRAAAALNYRPEWILAGDGQTDGNVLTAAFQEPSVWRHAWVVTSMVKVPEAEARPCWQAYHEVDNQASDSEVESWGCRLMYDTLRQLFIGIQVAGPRLGPATIDRGFHAIPRIASTDPQVPACFYDPADYSCVKDGIAEWWDPSGRPPGQDEPGCWRLVLAGRRSLPEQWPEGNVTDHQRVGVDECNGWPGLA